MNNIEQTFGIVTLPQNTENLPSPRSAVNTIRKDFLEKPKI